MITITITFFQNRDNDYDYFLFQNLDYDYYFDCQSKGNRKSNRSDCLSLIGVNQDYKMTIDVMLTSSIDVN